MTKKEAINIFGSVKEMSKALGIRRQAIYQWDDDLPQFHKDRVIGAALRLGLNVPVELIQKKPE